MKTRNLVNYYQTEKKLSLLSSNYYKKTNSLLLLFRMKKTNFSSRIPKQIKSKNEDNGYALISCIALDSKNWSCVLRNWDK